VRYQALTLRRFLLLLVACGVLYVTAIATVLAVKVAPAARELEEHSEQVLLTHDEAARRLPFLEEAVDGVRRMREQARSRQPARDSIRDLVEAIRLRLDSVTAVRTTAALAGIPGPMRVALANTVESETAVEIELLRALSELELGRPDSAEQHLDLAEEARQRTDHGLRAIQRMAVGDLVERQRRVAELARFERSAVSLWLILGLIMLPLVAHYVRRRIHEPLRELEAALSPPSRLPGSPGTPLSARIVPTTALLM
jgi:hypothetical protein